jgi:hypothetical protein
MRLAFYRTLEDAIIVRVIGDDVQRGLGRDHLPNPHQELETPTQSPLLPVKIFPKTLATSRTMAGDTRSQYLQWRA